MGIYSRNLLLTKQIKPLKSYGLIVTSTFFMTDFTKDFQKYVLKNIKKLYHTQSILWQFLHL